MKITQGKVVDALIAINHLSRQAMPSFTAYKLFRLKKKMKDVADFQAEEEDKLVKELGGEIDKKGRVIFEGDDKNAKYAEYAQRHLELEGIECEIDTEKMVMAFKEIPEISISDMEILDPFIEWKE